MVAKEELAMAMKKTETAKTKKTVVKRAEIVPVKTAKPEKAVSAKSAKPAPAKTAKVMAPKPAPAKTAKPAPVKAPNGAPAKTAKEKAPGRPAAAPAPAAAPVAAPHTREVIPVEPKPSARTCPLVLDGIMSAEDFSPRDCRSCDEFDCRFYAAEETSGGLGSRLFAPEEDDDGFDNDGFDDDEGFGADDDMDDYDEMR